MPSEIKSFHKTWYVITKVREDNLDELKKQEEMKVLLNTAITTNSAIWKLTIDEKYQKKLNEMNNLNRDKLKVVEEIIGKIK